jgi:hypothetical protein
MTTMTLRGTVRCEPATNSARVQFGRSAREATGRWLIGLTGGHPFASLAALCRRIGWSLSNASRTQSGEQSPAYETAADTYASHVLPLLLEEQGPPLDPRMYLPFADDLDEDGDGLVCEWEDAELVMDRMTTLIGMLRVARRQHGKRDPRVRAIVRAISKLGQKLSHMVRHEDGAGAGQGI